MEKAFTLNGMKKPLVIQKFKNYLLIEQSEMFEKLLTKNFDYQTIPDRKFLIPNAYLLNFQSFKK
jgi:hypothetical protein